MADTKTKTQLNQYIADLSQLQVNLQQTHWYMRGPQFFKLHPLMDDYAEELADQLDEIAERLISIGGDPIATTHEFIATTKLPDEPIKWNQYTQPELLQRLVNQYKYLSAEYEKGIELTDTDEEKDFVTQDILIAFKTAIDKDIWMISAYLGKGPKED